MRGGVGGEGVIKPKSASNREGSVGDVVNLSGGPLFLAIVDESARIFREEVSSALVSGVASGWV
jgi:hypothetical protein